MLKPFEILKPRQMSREPRNKQEDVAQLCASALMQMLQLDENLSAMDKGGTVGSAQHQDCVIMTSCAATDSETQVN